MLINYYYLTQCLTLTAWWSNPYSLSYWGETWFVERCSDVENVEGQFKVIGGYRGQIRTHCPMEVKLGWWSDIPMPKIVKVNSRSSGSQGSNPYILSYGSETLLVNKYSDAENCQRQFKVIRGHFQKSEFNRLTYFVPSKGHRHILTVLYSSLILYSNKDWNDLINCKYLIELLTIHHIE